MPYRRPRGWPVVVVVSLGLVVPAISGSTSPAVAAPAPAKPYDFDGDGRPDLTIGAPRLTTAGATAAGGVVVLRATKAGVSSEEQVLTRGTTGVPGAVTADESFGRSVTSADFDQDGYADLAVGGTPVTLVYGSASGLTGARSSTVGSPDDDADDAGPLTVGDFDADGWVDLAVGMPVADVRPGQDDQASGAVRVYRGGPQSFSAARSWLLRGDRAGADPDLRFGASLAVGDLDRDGKADLVVGAPGPEGFDDDDEGFRNPGSVSVCPGSSDGLGSCNRLVRGFPYAGLRSLTVGDVSGDARPEIVFGVPDPELITDDSGVHSDSRTGGAVEILSLSGRGGATTAEVQELTQDSRGVRGSAEPYDEFGAAVALGDLDRDGRTDLVVGAPGENKGRGRVTVVYGAPTGYRRGGGKVYDQDTRGVPGKAEKGDRFGASLTLLDHDVDTHLDLSVGAPGENDTDGAVTTLRGSGTSFTRKGARTFTLADLGYPTPDEATFGRVLGQ